MPTAESTQRFTEQIASNIRGDLHYLKSHPQASVFVEAVKRFPRSFGLSHDAEGKPVRRDGKTVVESINRVFSVDIVGHPATNKGLFESKERKVNKTVRQIVEENPKHEGVSLLEGIMKRVDGMGDVSVTVEDGSDADDQVRAATLAGAASVGKLLEAQAKAASGDGDKPRSSDTKGDGAMTENEKLLRQELDELKEERARDKAELAACKMLESASVEATAVRVAAIVRCSDDKERKMLIEDLPKREQHRSDSSRPVTSRPRYDLHESEGDEKSYNDLLESHGTSLFGRKK